MSGSSFSSEETNKPHSWILQTQRLLKCAYTHSLTQTHTHGKKTTTTKYSHIIHSDKCAPVLINR